MVVDDYTEYKNSVLNMVAALDTACQDAIDPPDGSPILISKRIFTGKKGRPALWIDPVFLAVASKLRGPTHLAKIFGVSRHTIRRLQIAYGIRERKEPPFQRIQLEDGTIVIRRTTTSSLYSTMTEEELNDAVEACIVRFEEFGHPMTDGYLMSNGHRVQRRRVKQALDNVRGVPAIFGNRRISRRVYHVKGPNSLWHMTDSTVSGVPHLIIHVS